MWLARILIAFGIPASIGVTTTLLTDDVVVVMGAMYFTALICMFGVELSRKGGSILLTGLAFTRQSAMQILDGIALPLVLLTAIGLVAISLGGNFAFYWNPLSAYSLTLLCVASIGEELFVRGTVLQSIRERFGMWPAIIVTSLFFAIGHMLNPGAVALGIFNVFLAGVLLSIMVIKTESLWMSISFHLTWNISLWIFIGNVSGNELPIVVSMIDMNGIPPTMEWLVTGSFGIEQGAFTTLILIISSLAMLKWLKPDSKVVEARFNRDLIANAQEVAKPA